MNTEELTRAERKLKNAIDPATLSAIGKEVGFAKRMRTVRPDRLVIALLTALAVQRVETLADILRTFCALTGRTVEYKPFHNQLAKAAFPELMRRVLCHLLENIVVRALQPLGDSVLGAFEDVVMHDGSSFALKASLAPVYPGRFTKGSPAAVELHATVSLFDEQPLSITLAADKEAEVHFLPDAASLKNKLFLGDRGFSDTRYCASVDDAGGWFVIRFRGNVNPRIRECYVDGVRQRALEGRHVKAVRPAFQGHQVDLDVEWGTGDAAVRFRQVLCWNPEIGQHMFLGTNLPRDIYTCSIVRQLYALRWQIELMFKEWKSYANLHRFNTSKPQIAEGLIWASLAAALLKRFLAHAAQWVHAGVPISTRRVAMALSHHLPQLLVAVLRSGDIRDLLLKLLHYIVAAARRAHPDRDRKRGRLSLGLQHAG